MDSLEKPAIAASISSGLGNSFAISTIFCTVPPFVLTLYRPGPALKRWGVATWQDNTQAVAEATSLGCLPRACS